MLRARRRKGSCRRNGDDRSRSCAISRAPLRRGACLRGGRRSAPHTAQTRRSSACRRRCCRAVLRQAQLQLAAGRRDVEEIADAAAVKGQSLRRDRLKAEGLGQFFDPRMRAGGAHAEITEQIAPFGRSALAEGGFKLKHRRSGGDVGELYRLYRTVGVITVRDRRDRVSAAASSARCAPVTGMRLSIVKRSFKVCVGGSAGMHQG